RYRTVTGVQTCALPILPKVQAVDDRCFNPDRLVKSLRKLCVVIIELAPAATQHSLTRAEQVIGHAEARSIEQSAIREPGERHARSEERRVGKEWRAGRG